MIYQHECDLHSNLLTKIFEHCVVKVFCIVDHDVAKGTIQADDVLLENFSYRHEGYIREGLHLYPFCEVFNNHDGDGVIAFHGDQFANYVDPPSLKGPCWCY
jgi:hypothetical protein